MHAQVEYIITKENKYVDALSRGDPKAAEAALLAMGLKMKLLDDSAVLGGTTYSVSRGRRSAW